MKRQVIKIRDFRPYAEHYHAAKAFYQNASDTVRGSKLQSQACLVFCAFAVEAYLNHLGAKFLKYWSEVERLPVRSKLKLILIEFGVEPEFGKRPLQTISELFRYRDWMAHSRSGSIEEVTEHDTEVSDSFLYATPAHEWESFTDLTNVSKCIEDVAELIDTINSRCPEPETMPLVGVTSHTYMTKT